jgi:hypothetical protein
MEVGMKRMVVLVLLLAMVTGCGFVYPSVRPAEMTQREYAAAGYRAGAGIVVANPYQATNADVYIYSGSKSQNELLLNVNGKNVVLREYLDHFWIMNAVANNRPTVARRLLDVNKCYTLLMVIHWGVAGDYSVETRQVCTSTDATRDRWQDNFGRQYVANVVIVLSGTDSPAMQRFDPTITVYPNNAARQLLYGIINFGR